ncbi:MAG: hypothetical protein ABFS46_01050 [Myxococcota bacterium]
MLWRVWTFVCGLPLGALGAWALNDTSLSLHLISGALAGGGVAGVAASLVARRRADDPERGAHLAAGASWALIAVPALASVWLGLEPGAGWLWLLAAAAGAVGLVRGARRRGPALGTGRLVARLTGGVLASSAFVLALAALAAALTPEIPAVSEARAAAVYDADAQVATRPLPRCRPRVARVRTLLDRGAHPRLDLVGRHLWFDTRAPDGTVQVHRMDRETGVVLCWTCGEPGNNRRPAPEALGRTIVFDSDRHLSWREPTNTELYLQTAEGETPRHARRITSHPGGDDHAVFSDRGVVVWSREEGGRYDVVAATLRSGHGSRSVGVPGRMFRGGTRWTIPLDWSPDRRSLVVGSGQPWRPLRVSLLDPATAEARELPGGVAPGSSASFSADGGFMFLATTERAGASSLLPAGLGFLLARLPGGKSDAARFRTTRVDAGVSDGAGRELDLGELASWGSPTGIAAEPDGGGFVLGQRRFSSDGTEERLLAVELDCD